VILLRLKATFRDAELHYHGSSRATIQRIAKKLEAANTVDFDEVSALKMTRPRMLTDKEE
jgi:hypothetical protein